MRMREREASSLLDLSSILEISIGPGTKGVPMDGGMIRIGDVGQAGWRLHTDLQMPAAVLRRSALANNADWMRRFVDRFGVALCPHGKTTMAPQLFDRQLRDGAWGLSCATIPHLRIYRRFGVKRVIYANQIVSAAAAHWLAAELAGDPDFEVFVFVDSVTGAELLSAAAQAVGQGRTIPLLMEIGVAGARTGVRGAESAMALARHVDKLPGVALAGVTAFEGVVVGSSDLEMEPHVEALFAEVVAFAEACARADLFDPSWPLILSAGGSRFFDLAASRLAAAEVGRPPLVVLRSGCYISHDAHHYKVAFDRLLQRTGVEGIPGGLANALEVWAEIQSRPEPGWLYANLGKRDISHDIDPPRVLASWSRAAGRRQGVPSDALVVRKLSDQHAHLSLAQPLPLSLGDQLGFGVSHPCTTFDKWRVLFEVDDDGHVLEAIATFF